MRVSLRRFRRFGLLLVSTAALWSMGPLGKGLVQTQPAVAAAVGPFEIHQLGKFLALETYYDVASSQFVSAGGYGGPGHSGGAGDAIVSLVNVGNFESGENMDEGALCANIYVFDDDQELQACCSCFVSADGVRTISTISDLISNPAFNRAKTSLGAIKVVGSGDTGPRGLDCLTVPPFEVTAAELTPADLAQGLRATINHAESIASNLPPSFAFVTSTSVDEFANAPLDSGELTELTTNCSAIVNQGSGAGICGCGSGENGFLPVL